MASVIRGSDNFDSVYAKPKAQCTAWVNFDGTTTPPTIRDSYNVSSVVRTKAGAFDIYFSTPMDNINYSVNGIMKQYDSSGAAVRIIGIDANDIGKAKIYTGYTDSTGSLILYNDTQSSIQIFGGKN